MTALINYGVTYVQDGAEDEKSLADTLNDLLAEEKLIQHVFFTGRNDDPFDRCAYYTVVWTKLSNQVRSNL